jgi:hypothetical protein
LTQIVHQYPVKLPSNHSGPDNIGRVGRPDARFVMPECSVPEICVGLRESAA